MRYYCLWEMLGGFNEHDAVHCNHNMDLMDTMLLQQDKWYCE